jgi:Arc/MetJ family transcription regulator
MRIKGSKKNSLTYMHLIGIIMHMARTTLNIDSDLVLKAQKLTGVSEKTSLVRMGLQALITKESAKKLAKLGGSDKSIKPIKRRRSS